MAEAAVDKAEGVALPQLPARAFNGGGPMSVSDTHFLLAEAQPEEERLGNLMVHRVSDGVRVRTIANPSRVTAEQPVVDGASIVQISESALHSGYDTLTTTDIESGLVETLRFPTGSVIGFGQGWILSCRTVDDTNDCRVRLTTAAGVDTLVGLSVNYSAKVSTVDRGPHRAVVSTPAGVQFSIDIVTGDLTELEYPQARAIAGNRAFWTSTEYVDGIGSRTRLSWMDRDGTNPGSVIVDAPDLEYDYRAFGNRVALLRTPQDGSSARQELRPVNLASGQLEPRVAFPVVGLWSRTDGAVMLALADTANGRMAILDDDGNPARTVVDLAPAGQAVDRLGLSRGIVAATWIGPSGVDRPVYFTSVGGSEPWSTLRPGQPSGSASPTGSRIVDYSADTLVTDVHAGSGSGNRSFRIAWPGGDRTVTTSSGTPRLGNGAQLIARHVRLSGVSSYQVEDVRTGVVKETLPLASEFALDGSWIWTLSTDAKLLTGRDTVTGTVNQRALEGIPADCGRNVEVLGRWAMVTCDNRAWQVVDLTGAQTPWAITPERLAMQPVLGNGFIAWSQHPNNDAQSQPVLKVASLAGSHEERTYGPVRGLSSMPGATYVADDSSPLLVYADSRHQVRSVDVGWALPRALPDVTAPRVTRTQISPSVTARPGATATFAFHGADDRPGVTFSVAHRTHSGSGGFGPWTAPTSWNRLAVGTVSRAVTGGTTTCFRVRARDAAGNTSPWSGEKCSTAPLDDRSLAARGKVLRAKVAGAMNGTESVLARKGASIATKKMRGREVQIIGTRGRKAGAVAVYVGSKKIANLNFKSTRAGRFTFRIRSSQVRIGSLRIVSTTNKQVRIDGVVILP